MAMERPRLVCLLRHYREAAGCTQEDLAMLGGWQRQYISEVERCGRIPEFGNLVVMGWVLGVSAYRLCGISDPPKRPGLIERVEGPVEKRVRPLVWKLSQMSEREMGLLETFIDQLRPGLKGKGPRDG